MECAVVVDEHPACVAPISAAAAIAKPDRIVRDIARICAPLLAAPCDARSSPDEVAAAVCVLVLSDSPPPQDAPLVLIVVVHDLDRSSWAHRVLRPRRRDRARRRSVRGGGHPDDRSA